MLRRAPRGRFALGVFRKLLRSAALVAAAVCFALLTAQPAEGHAYLVRSDPASGVALSEAPQMVRLWFSEPLLPETGSARLVDGNGRAIGGAAVTRQDDARQLVVRVPRLGSGAYGVLWQVQAVADNHRLNGTLVFSIGAAATSSSQPGPAVLEFAPRWARLCLLAGLLAALAAALVLRRITGSAGEEILTFANGCAWLGVCVGLAELVGQAAQQRLPGTSWGAAYGDVLSAHWGFLWLAREAAFLLVALLLTVRRTGWVLAACAPALALVEIEAMTRSGNGLALAADTAGILAACLWLGALPVLILLARRAGIRRIAFRSGALLAAGSLLTVGVLAETAPVRGGQTGGVVTRTGSVADLVVAVSATPGEPGLNGFTVLTASTRRPPPAAVGQVRLVVGATARELPEVAPGRYFGTAEIPAPGPDRIDAVLDRAGQRLTVTIPWQRGIPAPTAESGGLRHLGALALVLLTCGAT